MEKYILHITCNVNNPKPWDSLAVIVPVAAEVVAVTPVTDLVYTGDLGQVISEATENQIIQHILGMEPHEYRRKVRRGEEVPDLPSWEIGGFALMTPSHIEAAPHAYQQVAKILGLD